jgi:hypothetical protein
LVVVAPVPKRAAAIVPVVPALLIAVIMCVPPEEVLAIVVALPLLVTSPVKFALVVTVEASVAVAALPVVL